MGKRGARLEVDIGFLSSAIPDHSMMVMVGAPWDRLAGEPLIYALEPT